MNIHILLSPFKNESRVIKELHSLEKEGIFEQILVIALWEEGLEPRGNISDISSFWRVRLQSRKLPKIIIFQIVKYFEFAAKIILWMREVKKIDVVQAHSLSALPVAVLAKLLWGAKIVYDAHELETETIGLRGAKKALSKLIEKILIRFADAVLVVSSSIANWYKHEYQGINPVLVKNVPNHNPDIIQSLQESSSMLKEICHIKNSHITYIYQGGLFPGRGIEKLLTTFTQVQGDKHIVFMGYGSLSELVEKYGQQYKNIHFLQAVTPEEILKYTTGADVGICYIENESLSYYYSLPNKLFEYILAGLPVIINDMPDQKEIVEKYNCGWVCHETKNNQVLMELVNTTTTDIIREKKRCALQARNYLGWHIEEKLFLKIYGKLT